MENIKNFILNYDYEKSIKEVKEKNQWVNGTYFGFGGNDIDEHYLGNLSINEFQKKLTDYISLLCEDDNDFHRDIGIFLILMDEYDEYLDSVKLYTINIKNGTII